MSSLLWKMLLGAGGGAAAVAYTLYDAFTTDRAAGAVNGTVSESPYATGGGVTRTVTDTNSKITIGSGVLSFATGEANLDGIWWAGISRAAGVALIGTIVPANTNARSAFGWDTNAAGAPLEYIQTSTSGTILVSNNAGSAVAVGTYTATSYQMALILRASGCWYFIKGGAFSNWTLLWTATGGNGATMIPGLITVVSTGIFTADNIRVPVDTYIPTPLCFDSFTR